MFCFVLFLKAFLNITKGHGSGGDKQLRAAGCNYAVGHRGELHNCAFINLKQAEKSCWCCSPGFGFKTEIIFASRISEDLL